LTAVKAFVAAVAGTVDDTLCAITDAAFAGQVPPYPTGSWQATF
jgi:hypothetical protein